MSVTTMNQDFIDTKFNPENNEFTLYIVSKKTPEYYMKIYGDTEPLNLFSPQWTCNFCNNNLKDRNCIFQILTDNNYINEYPFFCDECIYDEKLKKLYSNYYDNILYRINEYFFIQ